MVKFTWIVSIPRLVLFRDEIDKAGVDKQHKNGNYVDVDNYTHRAYIITGVDNIVETQIVSEQNNRFVWERFGKRKIAIKVLEQGSDSRRRHQSKCRFFESIQSEYRFSKNAAFWLVLPTRVRSLFPDVNKNARKRLISKLGITTLVATSDKNKLHLPSTHLYFEAHNYSHKSCSKLLLCHQKPRKKLFGQSLSESKGLESTSSLPSSASITFGRTTFSLVHVVASSASFPK